MTTMTHAGTSRDAATRSRDARGGLYAGRAPAPVRLQRPPKPGRRRRHVSAFCAVLSLAIVCPAEDLTLVRQGQPQASIVLAARPTTVAQLGAFELQHHVRLMTGAELPIVRGAAEANEGARILVGPSEATRALGVAHDGFAPQEYLIAFRPGVLILAGDDQQRFGEVAYGEDKPFAFKTWPSQRAPVGTLHAVYQFLERTCGVRWWNPTDFGTDAPSRTDLIVDGEDVRRQPAFLYRDLGAMMGRAEWLARADCYWTDEAHRTEYLRTAYARTWERCNGRWERLHSRRGAGQLWLFRMRMGGTENFEANHSISGYFTRFWEKNDKQPEHFVEHKPEWFARGDDTPRQLCFSNPELTRQIAEDAARFFEEHPERDYFQIVPNDGGGYCQCDDCRALYNEDGRSVFFANGHLSNYWFTFINRLARLVRETNPDKYIATLAYASYADAPGFPVEDNVAVEVCLHARHVYDEVITRNDMRIARDWQKMLPDGRRFLWLYYTFPRERAGFSRGRWHCFPGFFMHHIGDIFKTYHELGYRGAFFNGWAGNINAYLTMQMLHDPAQDVDAILDEYFTRYYGSAAEPMRRLFLMIEDTYSNPAHYQATRAGGQVGHQTEDIAWGWLGTRERMQTLTMLMDEARSLAPTDLERTRIDIFDKAVFSYMQAGRAKYEDRVLSKRLRSRQGRVHLLRGEAPAGDPGRVNWRDAFPLQQWYGTYGEDSQHRCLGRIAHDGTFLYLRYDEPSQQPDAIARSTLDKLELHVLMTPRHKPGIGGGITHELRIDRYGAVQAFVGGKEDVTLRQPWAVRVAARSRHPGDRWVVELAVPLEALGLEPGDRLFLNLVRRGDPTGDEPMWVPTGGPVHAIKEDTPLGMLTLDESAGEVPPLPDHACLSGLRRKGLIGWWRFDEDEATVALDSSGNNLHGEYKGWRGGRIERCAGLEGQALFSLGPEHICFVEVPDHDALDLSGPLTLEAWVRRDAGGWCPYIAGKGYGAKCDGAYSLHLRDNGTRLWFEIDGPDFEWRAIKNTQFNPRDGNSIPPYVWTHLAAVWDGRHIALYINGRRHPWEEQSNAQGDAEGEAVAVMRPIRNSAEPLRIGTCRGCSPFHGAMDEIAIYDRPFSAEEVYARFLEGCSTLGPDR